MREPFGSSLQETGLFQISHSLTLCRSCSIKQGKKLLWIFTLTHNVRIFIGNPTLENVELYLLEWSDINMQVFVLLIFMDLSWGGCVPLRFCSSVPDAMREAKRESVEPLENMNWQKDERCCHLHHCVQVHQEKPEWKSFSPFVSHSLTLPASTPSISPSLSFFISLSFPLSSLSSLTTAYSPHTRANRNFHSRLATLPSYSGKWEHAARMHTLKEALWIFKC